MIEYFKFEGKVQVNYIETYNSNKQTCRNNAPIILIFTGILMIKNNSRLFVFFLTKVT